MAADSAAMAYKKHMFNRGRLNNYFARYAGLAPNIQQSSCLKPQRQSTPKLARMFMTRSFLPFVKSTLFCLKAWFDSQRIGLGHTHVGLWPHYVCFILELSLALL